MIFLFFFIVENFTDTLKRRSWENSNKNLHSHGKHQESDASSRNDIKLNDSSSSSPLPSSPLSQKMSSPKSDTDRKEERDIFKLAKKIKNFRKGNIFKFVNTSLTFNAVSPNISYYYFELLLSPIGYDPKHRFPQDESSCWYIHSLPNLNHVACILLEFFFLFFCFVC